MLSSKSKSNVCLLTYKGIICSIFNLEIVLSSLTEMKTSSSILWDFLQFKKANYFFPIVLPAAWGIELVKLPFLCWHILYFFHNFFSHMATQIRSILEISQFCKKVRWISGKYLLLLDFLNDINTRQCKQRKIYRKLNLWESIWMFQMCWFDAL